MSERLTRPLLFHVEDDRIDGIFLVKVDGKVLEVPRFRLDFIPPSHCSSYAKSTVKQLFGAEYVTNTFDGDVKGDAWNLRYFHKFIPVGFTRDVLDKWEEGDLMAIYTPRSRFNEYRDMQGKPIEFTHTAAPLGVTSGGSLLVSEQYRRARRIVTARRIMSRGDRIVGLIRA